MSDRRCLCFFEALDGIRSDGGDVAERQIEVSSFSEADISVSLHAEQCGYPHSGRRTMGFDMRRLGFDPSVWRAFFHTRLWRGVLPAMALAFTVIFLFYCVVGGASESAVMRRALVAAGVCGFGYVVGIWCAVQPDREEEEEEANGGRETISARLKLAGCALAAFLSEHTAFSCGRTESCGVCSGSDCQTDGRSLCRISGMADGQTSAGRERHRVNSY